jgi:hypothetical protein
MREETFIMLSPPPTSFLLFLECFVNHIGHFRGIFFRIGQITSVEGLVLVVA